VSHTQLTMSAGKLFHNRSSTSSGEGSSLYLQRLHTATGGRPADWSVSQWWVSVVQFSCRFAFFNQNFDGGV